MKNVKEIKKQLKKYSSVERKKTNEWFFKTGKGEYGEGDRFIGVSVPDTRKVARAFLGINLSELKKVLDSEIHEERLFALLILVEKNKQAIKARDKKEQQQIVKFYLKNKKQVNNWDLVDTSAHYILGQAIMDSLVEESVLDKLVLSKSIWDRRIAIIATWIMIRKGKLDTTIRLSKKLLGDKEDLMHKAVGWMLREAWKKDSDLVENFLIDNYKSVPRTALRYAIEKMEDPQRKRFLRGEL